MAAQVVTSYPQKRSAEYESAHRRQKKSKPTQENRYTNSSSEEEEKKEDDADAAGTKGQIFNGSSQEDLNGNSEEEDEYSLGEAENKGEDEASGSSEEEERGEENGISRNKYAENDDDEGNEPDHAGSSEEDEIEEGCSGRKGEKQHHFAEGSNAFRAAFTRIMEKKVPEDALGPVLSAHKKLIAKKLDEEANDLKVKSEAKKEKRLMKEKGHVIPENFLDAKEKSLIKLATKGVVKLFNAVSKAQSVQNAFDVSKSKDAKAASKERKAAFLQELRGATRSVKPGQLSSTRTLSRPNKQQDAKEPGWAALRDDFMLTSSKLKDWDKMPGAAADAVEETQVSESENSSDDQN